MSKKIIASILALWICSSAIISVFAEEEIDFPCGGVIENLPAEIVYFPIQNLVVFGEENPDLSGALVKVTYPGGTNEIVKFTSHGNTYYAGEFSANIYDFSGENISEKYGFVTQTISMHKDLSRGGYSIYIDLVYLHIPTFAEAFEIVSNYFNNIF